MDQSCVDYLWIIVMFLSAVWTLILTAPIHTTGSIGEHSHFFLFREYKEIMDALMKYVKFKSSM